MNYPWRSYNALPISKVSFCVSLGLSQGWDNIVLMTQSKVGWVKAILYEKLLRTLRCPNSMEIITTCLCRKHCMCLRRWSMRTRPLISMPSQPRSQSKASPWWLWTHFSFLCAWTSQTRGLVETFQFCAMKMDLHVGVLAGILHLLFLCECRHKCTFQLNDDHILSCI